MRLIERSSRRFWVTDIEQAFYERWRTILARWSRPKRWFSKRRQNRMAGSASIDRPD